MIFSRIKFSHFYYHLFIIKKLYFIPLLSYFIIVTLNLVHISYWWEINVHIKNESCYFFGKNVSNYYQYSDISRLQFVKPEKKKKLANRKFWHCRYHLFVFLGFWLNKFSETRDYFFVYFINLSLTVTTLFYSYHNGTFQLSFHQVWLHLIIIQIIGPYFVGF